MIRKVQIDSHFEHQLSDSHHSVHIQVMIAFGIYERSRNGINMCATVGSMPSQTTASRLSNNVDICTIFYCCNVNIKSER